MLNLGHGKCACWLTSALWGDRGAARDARAVAPPRQPPEGVVRGLTWTPASSAGPLALRDSGVVCRGAAGDGGTRETEEPGLWSRNGRHRGVWFVSGGEWRGEGAALCVVSKGHRDIWDLQPETTAQPGKTSLVVRTTQRTWGSRAQVSQSGWCLLQAP